MAVYLVELPDSARGIRFADAMVVSAEDATDAKAIAKTRFTGDGNGSWDAATVTALADILESADDALIGWRLRVKILDSVPVISEEVVGTDADDDIDAIGALMVTALNENAIIAGAAWTAGSNTLTIAETTDGLGDKKVEVEFLPPATVLDPEVSIPSFVGTITDEGAAGAALSVVIGADDQVVPTILQVFKKA